MSRFTQIVQQFMRLTKGECRISELDSKVDINEDTAHLSFLHEDKKHELDVKFEDDWFDVSVLERIAEFVRKPGKDFVYAHNKFRVMA